jgi:hypothetical protein
MPPMVGHDSIGGFFAAIHLVSQRDLDRSALYNSFGCEVIRPVSQWRREERRVTLKA